MVLMTMVGRTSDGLPLAASMQADEQSGREFQDYQAQAKQIFRKLGDRSPNRCNIETGNMMFHYIIDNGVCYLTLTEKMFPSRLAFGFLEDIAKEFWKEHSLEIPKVMRPYSFIEFDNYIQKSRKNFMDSRSRRNINRLNDELQDVQRIMVQNIDDVLQRGETLSVLDDKAGNLRYQSEKYKKDAKYLNLRTAYAKYAAVAIVLIIFLIYVRYWLF